MSKNTTVLCPSGGRRRLYYLRRMYARRVQPDARLYEWARERAERCRQGELCSMSTKEVKPVQKIEPRALRQAA